MGMKYIHLSIDMQLFAVSKQVRVLACGNFSDTSSLKLLETKGIGHVSANAVQECGWSILVLCMLYNCIAKLSSGLKCMWLQHTQD